MNTLITGINGFVGSHLAELLLDNGYCVHGTVRSFRSDLSNIYHIKDRLNLHICDLTDSVSVNDIIRKIDDLKYIFHLAASSFVGSSFNEPTAVMNNNFVCAVNLLEALRLYSSDTVILLAGSSEEYGLVHFNEVPIKETNPLRPLSPYGVSKVAQEMIGHQYYRSYGIKTVLTRAFNHEGPRRGISFFTSNMAYQLAKIKLGISEPNIYVGNLLSKRDITDVRDMVKAYLLAVKNCEYGTPYNICSSNCYSMDEVLLNLINIAGVDVNLKNDKSRMRPSDVHILYGDNSKFVECTGWKPEIELNKTLADLFGHWMLKL